MYKYNRLEFYVDFNVLVLSKTLQYRHIGLQLGFFDIYRRDLMPRVNVCIENDRHNYMTKLWEKKDLKRNYNHLEGLRRWGMYSRISNVKKKTDWNRTSNSRESENDTSVTTVIVSIIHAVMN